MPGFEGRWAPRLGDYMIELGVQLYTKGNKRLT